ncbi:carbamoyl-phosphate synthase large subunit [Chromobacterium sp. ATCC 53434]|uniref:ATP-grasp domain-containing protein n=1 Tax=Chromobacterium sp. (strain ATCC 53434 / SC 14030) TaxID=2059672 RepID=UPI000C77136A|nr:ATP-grasp domain-containing protein [Chromobacterium sp. ATCC 53434]AUH51728.1 carbamoyl-phosphate synthase large subunit [Chromobacterium sp. ATCC 53434]
MKKQILVIDFVTPKRKNTLLTAKEMGLSIALAAKSLSDEIADYVDRFIEVDPEDTDALLAVLEREHRRQKFDGVITLWDRYVEPCALIAERLDLPGNTPATAAKTRSKFLTRLALDEKQVPQPRFRMVKTLADLIQAAEHVGYPFIFKPVGACSSRGIFKVERKQDLPSVYQQMVAVSSDPNDKMFQFYAGEFLAEEYMQGHEFSVEGVASFGQLHIAGITEKWTTTDNFTETQHLFPARLSDASRAAMLDVSTRALEAIGFRQGAFHVELMNTAEGPKIVEINGRLGGDFITTHLVPLGLGIDISAFAFRAAIGEQVDLSKRFDKHASVKFLIAETEGVLETWSGREEALAAPGVRELFIERGEGASVTLPPKKYGEFRLAAVIAQGERADETLARVEHAVGLLKPSIV